MGRHDPRGPTVKNGTISDDTVDQVGLLRAQHCRKARLIVLINVHYFEKLFAAAAPLRIKFMETERADTLIANLHLCKKCPPQNGVSAISSQIAHSLRCGYSKLEVYRGRQPTLARIISSSFAIDKGRAFGATSDPMLSHWLRLVSLNSAGIVQTVQCSYGDKHAASTSSLIDFFYASDVPP